MLKQCWINVESINGRIGAGVGHLHGCVPCLSSRRRCSVCWPGSLAGWESDMPHPPPAEASTPCSGCTTHTATLPQSPGHSNNCLLDRSLPQTGMHVHIINYCISICLKHCKYHWICSKEHYCTSEHNTSKTCCRWQFIWCLHKCNYIHSFTVTALFYVCLLHYRPPGHCLTRAMLPWWPPCWSPLQTTAGHPSLTACLPVAQ